MKKNYSFLLLLLIVHFFVFSQGSGNSLSFDGNTQIVTVPSLSTNIGNSDFTIECFAKFSSFADYGGLITAFDSNNGGWAIHQELDGSVTFLVGINASGAGSDVIGSLALATGEWYHIVAVKNGTSLELFVNGESQGTVASNRVINYYQVFIGSRYLNNPFPGQLWRHNGELDEIRIWNSALTQAEIRDWMTKKVTSSHPKYANLVAYYNFDSGSGATLVDQTSNGNNGTLVNTPTWQTSSAPIGDDSSYLTSVDNTSSLNLVHSDGSDLTVNVTTGTAESLYIYNVEEEPNITTPPIGLVQLSQGNYFGVKAFGSSSLMYEVVYNYDGHSGISDENNLRLCYRTDNSTPNWTESSASLDIGLNTLTLGSQTGTEFILGSVGGNTLPVDEFELRDYTFFPNPTSDFLKLTEDDFMDSHYQIFDVRGRILLEGDIKFENKIDVRNLSEGLYFLKFENSESYKFIKNK